MAGRGFVKGEADHLHPEPTELDMGIGKRGDFTNPVASLGERLFALAGIGPIARGPPTWFSTIVVCGKARARR